MDSIAFVLRVGVVIAALIAVAGLWLVFRRTAAFGKRPIYAIPRGSGAAGVRYAFVEGMMPWEKDSARLHLATYLAGVIYHIGIFASLAFLIASVTGIELQPWGTRILQILAGAALICGMGLFIKRLSTPALKSISIADDFIANLLVDLFLLAAVVSIADPAWTPALYVIAILLFCYLPLGKVRHCFLFFVSRVIFGLYFGRRGVVPHGSTKAQV